MNKTDYLLVSDLDGTLLTHEKHITDINRDAINRFRESGGEITVATGRSVESARKYVNLIGVTLPVIVYNGVMLYDYKSDEAIWNDNLTDKARDYVRVIKEKFPEVGIEILRSDRIYVVSNNHHVKDHIEMEMLEYCECELDNVPDGWFKVLMALDEDKIPEVAEFINKQHFEDVYFVQSSRNYYEMLPNGASKGNALKMLCKLLGKNIKRTAAIGDYNNDCEMIQIANIGAAMGNAPENVKAVANIVVAENKNNGFSEMIDYILKNQF